MESFESLLDIETNIQPILNPNLERKVNRFLEKHPQQVFCDTVKTLDRNYIYIFYINQ